MQPSESSSKSSCRLAVFWLANVGIEEFEQTIRPALDDARGSQLGNRFIRVSAAEIPRGSQLLLPGSALVDCPSHPFEPEKRRWQRRVGNHSLAGVQSSEEHSDWPDELVVRLLNAELIQTVPTSAFSIAWPGVGNRLTAG